MMRAMAQLSMISVAATGLYLGCGGDGTTEPPPEDPKPTRAVAASGNSQAGIVGQALPSPLVVLVNDQSGNAMSGVGISFAVSAGNGSVSSPSSTTDAAGQASTVWTLGTVAGSTQQVTASVVGSPNVSVSFNATAAAGEAFVISMVSGDDQFAFRGTKLSELIAVRVRDRYANNVSGQIVAFTVPTGRGSVDSTVAFTGTNGEARTGWTVGQTVGEDTALASITGIAGSPVTFTATVHNLRVTAVSPTTVQLGGAATIVGTGFDVTAANNMVLFGDLRAVVNSATATQLEVTIPNACRPVGPVDVRVTVGGIPSAPVSVGLTPTSFLNMAIGEQLIVENPNDFCLQFGESGAAESYLIGVQSTSEAPSTITPVKFSSFAAAGASAAPASLRSLAEVSSRRTQSLFDLAQQERLSRHRAVEARIRAFDRINFDRIRSEWSGPQRSSPARVAAVDSTVAVGDIIPVRVTTGEGSCNEYDSVTTVVRVVGKYGIWLEDVENPSGGYTAADFTNLSNQFDSFIYPADTVQFGGPSDADNNGRIVLVVTARVNERGSLGFTTTCDFAARTASNMGSNEGEYFYGMAPDPNAVHGDTVTVDVALSWSPSISAHELVHVIQISGRAAAGGSFPAIWIAEGQATLGEEIVGFAMEGRAPGQNLPIEVAVNADDASSTNWHIDPIVDMGLYFGWSPTDQDPDIHLDEAPHECTWLKNDAGGPCVEGREAYGVPWSLLRWISDQYGPNYSGGEAGLHQDIIRGTVNGFALLEHVTGDPIETLLARWAAMLYADDRLDGANPVLEMTSWDLYDIFYGTFTLPDGDYRLWEALRLTPRDRGFESFTEGVSVRAGSTYYTLISGDGRSGTAVSVTDLTGAPLLSHMQVWVVRMQ